MGSRSARGTGVLPFLLMDGAANGLLARDGEILRVKSAGFMLRGATVGRSSRAGLACDTALAIRAGSEQDVG